MAKFAGWSLILTLLAALGVRAQVVQFTNGDRLTGQWVSVKGSTIGFQSKVVGAVSIPAAKVKSLTISEPLVAVATGGQVITGREARLTGGVWTIETARGGRTIPAKNLREILSQAAYRAVIARESAKPWRGWKGNANFGYSLQRGDQQTHTLSIGLNAVRHQLGGAGLSDRWRTTFTYNMLFAKASTAGAQVQSNSLSTSLRQDYFFRPNNFLFVLGQVDHIQSQNLYLQQTYGGGYGRDLLSGTRLNVSVLGGATFASQKFVGVAAEHYGEALLGERVGVQFTPQIRLDHALNFYPNLSNRGQYRFDTTSTLAFKLNSWLNANLGVIDFYISQIPSGAATTVTVIGPGGVLTTVSAPGHKNNLTVTAGIGANF